MKKSNCCGAPIIENTDFCSECREHCEPEFSLQDAKHYSILKWDAIVKNKGNKLTHQTNRELGIAGFHAQCGLCQLHNFKCLQCELRNLIGPCDISIYNKWHMINYRDGIYYNIMKIIYAKRILKAIKSIKC